MSPARTDFELIFEALNAAEVRYVVVGGVAVVLHGYARNTADLDLVVALEPDNARRAMQALGSLEYRPRAPVRAEDFADPAICEQWIEEKGLAVFSLWSPRFPGTEVDVFVAEPMPFDGLSARAARVSLDQLTVPVAGIEDLIAMKEKVGRPKDLQDCGGTEEDRLGEAVSERDRGFERHEEEQRRAWAALSPLQRLRWLQQAKEFARRWAGRASGGLPPGGTTAPK